MFKILIADDEQLERDALKFIISKGIGEISEIEEAINGREAISKVQTSKHDIVILDINMPGINGIDAAWEIRKRDPDIIIIFLTAFHQFDYAHEAIKVGAEDYIIKPSSEIKIIEVIETAIKKLNSKKLYSQNKQDIEIRLDKATDYLSSEFTYNLATRYVTKEKFDNYLTLLNVKFNYGKGLILRLDYESYPIEISSDYQQKILKTKCIKIFRNILQQNKIYCTTNMELTNIYIFAFTNIENNILNDVDEFRTIIKSIENNINSNMNLSTVIGIGSTFDNSDKAILSFTHAKESLEGLLTTSTPRTKLPLDIEILMEQSIIAADKNKIENLFIQLERWIQLSSATFEIKKNKVIGLVTILTHAVNKQFINEEFNIDTRDITNSLTIIDLTTSLKFFLNEVLESIIKLNKNEYSPAIKKACLYINKNYHLNIGLDDTAKYCNLSSFYFCKIFKSEIKQSFINYLTAVRISKSKKLLKETQMSMKEIATAIGYNDPNYFTRVFKKVIDCSPTEYRIKRH